MANDEIQEGWFSTWFDTDYYHMLYANRDEQEAARFVKALIEFIAPNPQSAHLLDLACGKGRHSIQMNKLGFRVTGADLSGNSISQAKTQENDRLKFLVQDMRIPLDQKFTHVFNLFTSFGYFDNIEDNERVIDAINQMTDSGATLVIDFLNAKKVRATLVPEETKVFGDVKFSISRKTDDQHVYKYIDVEENGQILHFMERVQLLTLSDFQKLLETRGFKILETFGDFQLHPFNEDESNRLIILAQKQ